MTAPRVVITDHGFADWEVERAILEPLGCNLEAAQCRTEQEVADLVADADYVLTQFAPVSAHAIEAMRRARLIVRYGIGVDNVDLEAAARRGIPVFNVPDYCIDEVADHTLALILALTRQIVTLATGVRAGRWKMAPPIENFHALRDMTVGVVGAGRIGRAVINRLVPFKPRILVFDPVLRPGDERALGAELVALDQIWAQSDLITLHVPSTAETRAMINAGTLARMKDRVMLINVSRGTLVDQDALIAALQSGKVAAAGLDVTVPEPINDDSPLLRMDNVLITSHIASASPRAGSTLRSSVAETVARAVRGEPLPPSVNGVQT
jgi:D-3-phosphoglycerate dehydrogenase